VSALIFATAVKFATWLAPLELEFHGSRAMRSASVALIIAL